MKAITHKTCFSVILFIAFTSMTFAQSAEPQVMVSNLNQLWPGQDEGNFGTVLPGSGFGFAFTTGSSSYQLNTVTFEQLGGPGTIQVELLASQGGVFNAAGQLGNPTKDSRPTQWPTLTSFIDYSPLAPITLAPETTYIIAAYEPTGGDDNTGLTFNFNNSYTVSADWAVYGFYPSLFYGDASSPPATFDFQSGWNYDFEYGSIMTEIDATPVPEPNARIIFFASMGMLGFFRLLKFPINRSSVI
jgi:hypothetical protein